jgi:hypothetical protein
MLTAVAEKNKNVTRTERVEWEAVVKCHLEEENLAEEQKALALETAREPHERREQLKEKEKTKRRQKETKGRKLRGPCDHRQALRQHAQAPSRRRKETQHPCKPAAQP